MKNKLLFILLAVPYFATAQNIIVYDSVNNLNLPYIAIQFGDAGIYTNENGSFNLNDITNDSLKIKFYGYNKLLLAKNNLKDTVFLEPKTQVLDEVIITNKKTEININQSKRTKMYGSWSISKETEIISIFKPNKKTENTLIEELSFGFNKLGKFDFPEGKITKPEVVVRINIYIVEGEIIKEKIYSKLKIIDVLKKDNVVLNIEEEGIYFSEEGLGFGIEFIKYVNNDLKSPNLIRPALAKEEYKDFNVHTIIRFPLNKNKSIYQLNKIINDGHFELTKKHKDFKRNLMMGFKLVK
ncbi:MAG: hypothetical protein QM499_12430 [Flavobacteriaceae bacterium]